MDRYQWTDTDTEYDSSFKETSKFSNNVIKFRNTVGFHLLIKWITLFIHEVFLELRGHSMIG